MTVDPIAAYKLDGRDHALLAAATTMLTKVARGKLTRPAELVSIAKLQHVLSRLPRLTPGIDVMVQIHGPRSKFGEIMTHHSWEVSAENGRLFISSDGYFSQPSTGGDSYCTMEWIAVPGRVTDFRDYREHLALVPDVRSFPDAVEIMEFTSGAFTVEITDADNPLLDDLEANNKEPSVPYADLPCEEKEAVETKSNHHRLQAWTVLTVDDAERRLAASIDSPEVDGNEIQYAIDVQKCDLCGCSLANRGLFVDGCLRGKTTRGSMCAQCFESQGEGIGWGSGQLYARQPNGDWRMVAGFRPEQSP